MTPVELRHARIWLARLRTRVQNAGVSEMPYDIPRARRAVLDGLASLYFEDGATLRELELVQDLSKLGHAMRIDDSTVDRMFIELDRVAVELLVAVEVRL